MRQKLVGLMVLVLLVVGVGIRPLQAADAVIGDGTPESCTEAAVDAAFAGVLDGDSNIFTFDCGGTATITFTSSKIVNATTITLDGGGLITLDGNDVVRHFYVDSGNNLTLKNITLSNGYDDTFGGGSILSLGGLTLENVTIRDSHVDPAYSGGAIFSYEPVTMTNSLIENNSGGSVGGLFLFGETAVATITDSTFRGNYTTNPDYGLGGAITLWNGADVTLLHSIVELNTAVDGAALYNSANGGEMYIREGSVLRDNEASQFGGAIFSSAGLVKIESSTVEDNMATAGGGISNLGSSHLIATDTTFVGNVAPPSFVSAGGAIDNYTQMTLANVTLSQNSAVKGGGISNSGDATLTHVTFSENSGSSGASIFNFLLGSVTLKNVLLNHGAGGANCFNSSSAIISQGFNISSDNSCELDQVSDQQNVDPLLGSLADNGGATWTHMLLQDSPAIDEGMCVEIVPMDQRGVARPQGSGCDIGAVERQAEDGVSMIYLPFVMR